MADIKPSYDSTHPHWNLDSVVTELRTSREGKPPHPAPERAA
ncbi:MULTISPECIES: hypothetical protein [Mycetohabitans]|nr:hypothetical protein [Mycetohabitans sp. B3]